MRNWPTRPAGRIFNLLLLSSLLAGCAPGGCAASAPASGGVAVQAPAQQPEGTVVRVRDGDSIVVLIGGVGVEVRLNGIDCPELAQAYGARAKRFTSGLVFGRRVGVIGKGRDSYGRELAEVVLPDGRSLNRELVAAGYAWWFRRHSSDRRLEALENEARAARRGLWADPDPLPPWEFRQSRAR